MPDASRFLAQSQSRISFAPAEDRRPGDDRSRRQNQTWRSSTASRTLNSRVPNPYQPTSSQLSAFPFASRLNPQQAPLFYSATDEFREENDEEEHERDMADFYALQRSRRQLGASDLKASADAGDGSGSSLHGDSTHGEDSRDRGTRRGGGIRSSWHGGVPSSRRRGPGLEDLAESAEAEAGRSSPNASRTHMVDIGLEDTLRSEYEDDPPEDLMEDPPSIQHLRTPRPTRKDEYDSDVSDSDDALRKQLLTNSQSQEAGDGTRPEDIQQSPGRQPKHDSFWGQIYLLNLAAMFTTWFLIFLHTDSPATNQPLGDTIYTTLHGSFYLLATYTLIATFVSLFWLAALRSYVRYLVYGIIIAVPVILYSFWLYPFIASYRGSWHGASTQDTIMRWSSLVPAVMATLWILAVIRGRLAMQKAISILEFATKILAANPTLVLVGFSVLGFIISFTWLWLSIFTRVFLGGHRSHSAISKFIIDTSTWWVGLYFILVYLWTIAVAFGMQRSITSATVSQWYFHRLAVPAPTSQAIVKAALYHSATTLFGTISLFTALSLLVRLPLLVLPRRLTMLLGVAMYSFIPSPIAVLINPLTLTYAAIHSQPLNISARGLSQMQFLMSNDATTSLHPNTFNQRPRNDGWSADSAPLLSYRLAKLILHATRFIMSLTLGFGGWVSTARSLKLEGAGVRGSLYAYVVGLIAGAIGWGILGAMEGVLACIVDAVVVCWGSEVGSTGTGEVRYCREAGNLFGENEDAIGRVSLA
ncbi:hypothetical protein H2202_004335 [Exophiala xenobiotica]|nr:hypothetical protein H2202_004335 [Exophiala xenobiotica]